MLVNFLWTMVTYLIGNLGGGELESGSHFQSLPHGAPFLLAVAKQIMGWNQAAYLMETRNHQESRGEELGSKDTFMETPPTP